MKVLIFHNPTAGSGETTSEELIAAFAEAGLEPVYKTKDKARPADAEGMERVVVAGGDGTVTSAFARFAGAGCPFAIVPLGGANNIATALGIRGGPRDVAQGLGRARPRLFRLGRAEGCGIDRTFVESTGLGCVAASLQVAGDRKRGGDKIRSGREALAELLRKGEPLRSEVTVDGRRLPDNALFAEILNVGLTGPALPLAPGMEAGGETLAVAWLPTGQRDAFIDALLGEEALPHTVLPASRVEVTWRGDALRIDDEVLEPGAEGCVLGVTRTDRNVEVVVPADAPGSDRP